MKGLLFQKKVSEALLKVNASSGNVYLRAITKTGTGSVLNKPTVTNVDTLITPSPAVTDLKQEELQASNSFYAVGDKVFIMPGDLSETTLKTSQIIYNSLVYKIIECSSLVYDGTTVAFRVVARLMGS